VPIDPGATIACDGRNLMRPHPHRFAALLFLLLLVAAAQAAPAPNSSASQTAIRSALDAQVAAWNRGDIASFMQGYKDSPATTFVGKTVQHGYATILDRYRTIYSGKEKMGELSFTDLGITLLDAHIATVTGRYHLTRNAAAGADAQGLFSLVFEKTVSGWKIILDHTS
jgi:ketosteroid isomerase-like protein